MAGRRAEWEGDLERWLAPFLSHLSHRARRAMCPLYVAGLIGPGDRKSVQPMAERLGFATHDRLHPFVSSAAWDAAPLEAELLAKADALVGGRDAYLVIDDTALPKKDTRSVGVAPQYASALGKNANCQILVSLTLARQEVPVPVALRLFLPETWTGDPERLARGGMPEPERARPGPSPTSPWVNSTESGPPACGLGSCWPMRATGSAPLSARPFRLVASSGQSAFRASRRCFRPRSQWCHRHPRAAPPVSPSYRQPKR